MMFGFLQKLFGDAEKSECAYSAGCPDVPKKLDVAAEKRKFLSLQKMMIRNIETELFRKTRTRRNKVAKIKFIMEKLGRNMEIHARHPDFRHNYPALTHMLGEYYNMNYVERNYEHVLRG